MEDVIKIVCIFMMGVIFFIEYIKNKKIYQFLGIIIAVIAIYFKTPLSNGISKILGNTLVGIEVILALTICYLLMQDNKGKIKNKLH